MSGLLNSLKNLATGGNSGKAGEDTNMRFSMSPCPGDSGYSQWLDAMKMVARLPGGIPPEFRKRLWITLAERHLQNNGVNWNQAERACFNEWSNPDDNELGVQIVKDLHRTGCSLFCGSAGQENQALLKRVLLAYARWNKAVGYCQGFNMLAALILQVMDRSETDAVKVMIYLIEGVLPESYFANNLRGLSVDMAVFRDLLRLRLPNLSRHLEALQNEAHEGTSYEPPLTNVFTMQWFLTLFCNCLPQGTVLRVWDLIFLEGNEILLRTALAIWDGLANRILAVNSADEFYSIMGVLTREMLEFGFMDANTLIKSVVTIQVCNELPELRDKYLYNITPWTQTVQSAAKKGFRLFYSDDDDMESDNDEKMAVTTAYGITLSKRRDSDRRQSTTSTIQPYAYGHPDREKLALDISALKQQYAKLRERQRQAHIILTAACTRQPMSHSPTSTPIAMNHLLLGKSAILSVRGRRLGPPQGAVPPSRNPKATTTPMPLPKEEGETLHWKDATKRRISRPHISEGSSSSGGGGGGGGGGGSATQTIECHKDNDSSVIIHSDSSSSYSDDENDDSSSTSTELCDDPGRASDFDCEEPSCLIDIPVDALNDSVNSSETDGGCTRVDDTNQCPHESDDLEPQSLTLKSDDTNDVVIVESPIEISLHKPKFETSRSIEVLRENQNILDSYLSSFLFKSNNETTQEETQLSRMDENETPFFEQKHTEKVSPINEELSLYNSISDILDSKAVSQENSTDYLFLDKDKQENTEPVLSSCRTFDSDIDSKIVSHLKLDDSLENIACFDTDKPVEPLNLAGLTVANYSPTEQTPYGFNYRKFLKDRGFDLSPEQMQRIKDSPTETLEKIVQHISPQEFNLENFLLEIAKSTISIRDDDTKSELEGAYVEESENDLSINIKSEECVSSLSPVAETTQKDSFDFDSFWEDRIRCLKQQTSIESMSSTKARIDSSEFNKTPSSDGTPSRKFSLSSFQENNGITTDVFESSPEKTSYGLSELAKDSPSISDNLCTETLGVSPRTGTMDITSEFEKVFSFSTEKRNSLTSLDSETLSNQFESVDKESRNDAVQIKEKLSFEKQMSLDSVPDERLEHGRRNSEMALKIIQENSMILHRILQCQTKSVEVVEEELKSSPNEKVDSVERYRFSDDNDIPKRHSWFGEYSAIENPIETRPKSIVLPATYTTTTPTTSPSTTKPNWSSEGDSIFEISDLVAEVDSNSQSTNRLQDLSPYAPPSPIVSPTKSSQSPVLSPVENSSSSKTKPVKSHLLKLQFPPLSPSRKKTPSPLSPDQLFNPFPIRPTSRQPKEVAVKLGLYKDPMKSPSK